MPAKKLKKPAPANEADVMRLYKAVAHYVKKRGGSVFVAGGIQIQEWPGERPGNFTVAIKCTGNKPQFAASRSE